MIQRRIRRIGQWIASTDEVRYIIEVLFFLVIVALLTIESVGGAFDTTQATVLGLLFSILISIEVLMRRVTRLQGAVTSRAEVIDREDAVHDRIRNYVTNFSPDTLYFVEYSSMRGKAIISKAIQNGCTVYLLVRHPNQSLKWRVSESQAQRTRSAISELLQLYRDYRDSGAKLHIQFYYQAGGLRARRIDNQTLYTGWYTFDNRQAKPPDAKHVHGDNNPMLAFIDQYEGYEALNEMFESAFYAHWKEGCSLAESLNDPSVPAVYSREDRLVKELADEVSGVRAEEIFPKVDEMRSLDDIEDPNIFVRPEPTEREVE